jgi:hypothetical protein
VITFFAVPGGATEPYPSMDDPPKGIVALVPRREHLDHLLVAGHTRPGVSHEPVELLRVDRVRPEGLTVLEPHELFEIRAPDVGGRHHRLERAGEPNAPVHVKILDAPSRARGATPRPYLKPASS